MNAKLAGFCARATLLVSASLMVTAATRPLAPPVRANWNTTVVVTPQGSHVLGNPAAPFKLTEYISYTCPHCSHFESQSDATLRLGYISTGKVAVEVWHLVRDPVDLTVAMLANCGPPAKFFQNHSAFMRGQEKWIAPLETATDAQRARWSNGTQLARRRAIAADFHLYEIMQGRGYDRPAADRCLADEAVAQRLGKQTQAAFEAGVEGTPSFSLNGTLLAGTHDWALLQPQLAARF